MSEESRQLSTSASTSPTPPKTLLLLPLVAGAVMLALLAPWHISWHWALPSIALCTISAYVFRGYWYVSESAIVIACLCSALMIQRQSQEMQVFFCELSGHVERVYPSTYKQRVRLRVDTVQMPVESIIGFKKISCDLPVSPVLRVGDYIQLRGLCRGEQMEHYYRWQLKANQSTVIHYREEGSRGVFWRLMNRIKSEQSLAIALVLGIASYQDQVDFRAAGIAHMLAVSGLHVGIIFLVSVLLLRFIAIPNGLRLMVLISVVLWYLWLTGMAIPTQRAAIMAVLVCSSQLLGRHLRAYAALSLAALIVLCLHPTDIYSAGFQLSFVAVFGIMYCGLTLRRVRIRYLPLHPWVLDRPIWRSALWCGRSIADALCIGIAASLAVTPLLIWHFQVMNPWSPLTTVVVTPIVAIIIASANIFGFLETLWPGGPWDIFVIVLQQALDALSWIREGIAQWPGAQIKLTGTGPQYWQAFLIWPLMIYLTWRSKRRLTALTIALADQESPDLNEKNGEIKPLPIL